MEGAREGFLRDAGLDACRGEPFPQRLQPAVVLKSQAGTRRSRGRADHQDAAVLGGEVGGVVLVRNRARPRAHLVQGAGGGRRILREPDPDDGQGRIGVGALGGMVTGGILGLFTGPVLLAIGYELFWQWVEDQPAGVAVEEP